MPQKADWDFCETSWDFTRHPLVWGTATMVEAYGLWEAECAERFDRLKANEEEPDRIFIDIYDLQDELTPGVEDKDVTVHKADQMIKIDLDDGVKKDQAIFRDVLAKIK